jgi:hypothetical protein
METVVTETPAALATSRMLGAVMVSDLVGVDKFPPKVGYAFSIDHKNKDYTQ